MSYITLKCKNCGASMSLNTESHSATCNHCSSTFLIADLLDEKDAAFVSKLSSKEIEQKMIANDALKKGETCLAKGDYTGAEAFFKKAIENDESNFRSYLGVVKANAYGHGAIQIAAKLEKLGADYLAVATFDEAQELRCNGINIPILVLGYTPVDFTEALIEYNITQAVFDFDKAKAYSAEAMRCGKTLKIHIKVDTGMSRLGFRAQGISFEKKITPPSPFFSAVSTF